MILSHLSAIIQYKSGFVNRWQSKKFKNLIHFSFTERVCYAVISSPATDFDAESLPAFRTVYGMIAFSFWKTQNAFAMRTFFIDMRFSVLPHPFSQIKEFLNAVFYA